MRHGASPAPIANGKLIEQRRGRGDYGELVEQVARHLGKERTTVTIQPLHTSRACAPLHASAAPSARTSPAATGAAAERNIGWPESSLKGRTASHSPARSST